jgi:hypothetical protein
LALAKTRRAQLVSVVQLYKALGGGWAPVNPAEPGVRPAVHSQLQADEINR